MMKAKWTLIGLFVAAALSAQTHCDTVREAINAPYYYCDCEQLSIPFSFPIDQEISDTTWFSATLNDLQYGLSAYWFANCSVTLEIYAFCASKEPSFTMTIGSNRMKELDVEEINAMLAEMGNPTSWLPTNIVPHMRVYPNGGEGRVYCYPYDEGPESRCDDPLPLRAGMTYVCDKPENVYRMEHSSIPTSGKAFIHWKQKKNKPCEMWLTLDSCAGEEIGRTALSDSLHVFMPNPEALLAAKGEDRSLWLHVKHAEGYTGRVYWRNNPKYVEDSTAVVIADSTCYGKVLTANLRPYTKDTVFTDTIWVAGDTLTTTEVALTFSVPEMEYDTVWIDSVSLSRGYVYTPTGNIFRDFGDYTIEIKRTDGCTNLLILSIIYKEKEETAFETVTDAQRAKAYKQIQNGQLFIILDERKYTILGQPIDKKTKNKY